VRESAYSGLNRGYAIIVKDITNLTALYHTNALQPKGGYRVVQASQPIQTHVETLDKCRPMESVLRRCKDTMQQGVTGGENYESSV
jgi:hypothetical protein